MENFRVKEKNYHGICFTQILSNDEHLSKNKKNAV